VRCRRLITTGIFCGLVYSTVDDCWHSALAIDKVARVYLTANRTSRTLPIESRRSIDRRTCADTRPNGHDPPKAKSTVAGPAHRLPPAGMLVKSTSHINWRIRWTYALAAICKRPFGGRVYSQFPSGWSFLTEAVGNCPVCARVCWQRARVRTAGREDNRKEDNSNCMKLEKHKESLLAYRRRQQGLQRPAVIATTHWPHSHVVLRPQVKQGP
jgi:hypothetical protein